jgi:hypothetical protein
MLGELASLFFSASITGGCVMGFEVCYSLSHFFAYGWDMFKHPLDHALDWMDVGISTGLMYAAITRPSIAIPLTVAGLVVRIYIRYQRHDGHLFAKIGGWIRDGFSWLSDKLSSWFDTAKKAYKEGQAEQAAKDAAVVAQPE